MNGLIDTASPVSPPIFDLLANLAEPTRARLLLVLEGQQFTVSELCTILQLPQSTVSRHLKVLAEEGWLVTQPDGTSRRYRMAARSLDPSAGELWALVRERVAQIPAARQDALRVRSVIAGRRSRSQEFFATAAGDWDRVRAEMFGDRVDPGALLGLLDPEMVVGDLGCGTGHLSESLAPFVARVIAIDASREMLRAAGGRLREHEQVELREGRLEALPVRDAELDAGVLFLVLHYVPEPALALAEAARSIRPGGRLLVVDMTPHDRIGYRNDMGHAWLGFSREQVAGWLAATGFESVHYHELPPDPRATGPALFVASARRAGDA